MFCPVAGGIGWRCPFPSPVAQDLFVSLPQIGTHIRAKRKREELSNVLAAMRKAAAKKD